MGSADAIPTAPAAAVVFVEDLPEAVQAKASMARRCCAAAARAAAPARARAARRCVR
jgi:hypothetical protein